MTTPRRRTIAPLQPKPEHHFAHDNDLRQQWLDQRPNANSNGVKREAPRTIVVYDTHRGRLGPCRALAERLLEYREHILQPAEDADGPNGRTRRIDARAMRLPHDWARRKDGTDALNPVVTEYAGVYFRSQLEAEWADRLDRLDMEWEHEPDPLPGWIPDFHISARGGHQGWLKWKPCAILHEDQVGRIDQSGYAGNAIILGKTGDCKWSRNSSAWLPLEVFPPQPVSARPPPFPCPGVPYRKTCGAPKRSQTAAGVQSHRPSTVGENK